MGIELVLLGICGLAFVILGVLAVAAFIIARTTGKSLLDLFGGLGGAAAVMGGGDDDADISPRTRRSARQRTNLRAQADSLDFDSAVAQYQPGDANPRASAAPRPAPPWETSEAATSAVPPVRRRRKRREDDEDDLDMMEGFLDGDSPL